MLMRELGLLLAPERERICFAFTFACVVVKNRKILKLIPMADDAITRGGTV